MAEAIARTVVRPDLYAVQGRELDKSVSLLAIIYLTR